MFGFDGKQHYIHRLSYELFVGPIPVGLCVCHHCDVKDCGNPYHYFIGTRADNNADAAAKGLTPRGMEKSNTKLEDKEVVTIRELYATGWYYQRVIGKMFGVRQDWVSRIVNRHGRYLIP